MYRLVEVECVRISAHGIDERANRRVIFVGRLSLPVIELRLDLVRRALGGPEKPRDTVFYSEAVATAITDQRIALAVLECRSATWADEPPRRFVGNYAFSDIDRRRV